MDDEKKDFFKLENKLKKEIYGKIDTRNQLLEELGIRESPDPKLQNLSFKPIMIYEKKNLIKVKDSIHTMGLQRSDYLQVDDEIM